MSKHAVLHPTQRDAIAWQEDAPEKEIGKTPEGRVAVVRRDGVRVAHVGHGAGASVAERLLGAGSHGVELKKYHEGKKAWVERQGKMRVRVAPVSMKNFMAAKGSVGEPRKPVAHARPRRGS